MKTLEYAFIQNMNFGSGQICFSGTWNAEAMIQSLLLVFNIDFYIIFHVHYIRLIMRHGHYLNLTPHDMTYFNNRDVPRLRD